MLSVCRRERKFVMKLRFCTGATLLFFLFVPWAVRAELSKQDRETAKSMITGTLYLRMDVPCRYGRGRFGIAAAIHHVESLLEVSPTGYSVERKLALPPKHKRDRVFWGLSPNDPVRYGKLLFKGDTVQVWMEGVEPDAYEMLLDFVHIGSMDDFTKAFNQTFSKVPLQDEHPEWPAEVRQAIAARKLVVGMTEDQAFLVVGKPLKVESAEEDGIKVESWSPRQDRATDLVRDGSTPTGFPAQLKFSGGRLQVIEQIPRAPDLSGK
jgi:hypothetical protein